MIGVVVNVDPLNSVILKNGVIKEKKTFEIADDSNAYIEITMWG